METSEMEMLLTLVLCVVGSAVFGGTYIVLLAIAYRNENDEQA